MMNFPNILKIQEVEANCSAIICELRSINEFVTTDKVLHVLLQRYSIMQFEQLGIGSFFSLALISLIWELNKKVSSFIELHFASRTIITLHTLESELVRYLKSLNFQPILPQMAMPNLVPVVEQTAISRSDPNEIDFETSDENEGPVDQSTISLSDGNHDLFTQFGLGSLLAHPMVAQYFPPQLLVVNANAYNVTNKDIVTHLVDYLAKYKCYQFQNDFKVEEFILYLCTSVYQVQNLQSIGILLQGSLLSDVLALKHIVNKRQELYADITRSELAIITQERQQLHLQAATNITDSNNTINVVQPYETTDFQLQDPIEFNNNISKFIERMRTQLNSPYSPSFGKLKKIVSTFVTAQLTKVISKFGGALPVEESIDSSSTNTKPGKRKKKDYPHPLLVQAQHEADMEDYYDKNTGFMGGNSSFSESTSSSSSNSNNGGLSSDKAVNQLVEVLTEYAMLHLGGRKYLKRRIVTSGEEEEDEDDEEEEEKKEEAKNDDDKAATNNVEDQVKESSISAEPASDELNQNNVEKEDRLPSLSAQQQETDDQSADTTVAVVFTNAIDSITSDSACESSAAKRPRRDKTTDTTKSDIVVDKTHNDVAVECNNTSTSECSSTDIRAVSIDISGGAAAKVKTESSSEVSVNSAPSIHVAISAPIDSTDAVATVTGTTTAAAVMATEAIAPSLPTYAQAQSLQSQLSQSTSQMASQMAPQHQTVQPQPQSQPPFEARMRTNLPPQAIFPDSLDTNIAVVTSAQLWHLLPNIMSMGVDSNDLKAVGRWGEMLVYQYLVANYVTVPMHQHQQQQQQQQQQVQSNRNNNNNNAETVAPPLVSIQWLNEVEESRASYDIVLNNGAVIGKNRTTYIEVKTTRYTDLNVFELSLWEWEFATKEPRVPYHIYRVFNAGDVNNVRIVILKDILSLLNERKVKLCLAI